MKGGQCVILSAWGDDEGRTEWGSMMPENEEGWGWSGGDVTPERRNAEIGVLVALFFS